jgi:hypothetical protein
MEAWLDELSSREMKKATLSARRAAACKNEYFLQSHIAWALHYTRTCLELKAIDLDDEKTQAALSYLIMTKDLLSIWQYHPLFLMISKSIVLEFPHTTSLLVAASYLAGQGTTVGFNDHADFLGQSPDLYINPNPLEKISLEVKAPQELQWPANLPSPAALEDLLAKQINKASKQITGEWGGVVVIGASWADDSGQNAFEAALKSLDERKKISSRVAGVVGVAINIFGHYRTPDGGAASHIMSKVIVQPNSRFSGEQFLKDSSS